MIRSLLGLILCFAANTRKIAKEDMQKCVPLKSYCKGFAYNLPGPEGGNGGSLLVLGLDPFGLNSL